MPLDPSDDYYVRLGVTYHATATELRRAWRKLALQWHPDRAGPAATAAFQNISAAYAVLSDPLSRAAYDRRRGLTRASTRSAAETNTAVRNQPAAPSPEPRRKAPGVMLSRLNGSMDGLLACGVARRVDPGLYELWLNPSEAAQGGMVTISMRVPVRCAVCDGAPKPCVKCGGQGTTQELFAAWLAVPPEAKDGLILTPSANLKGMVQPVSFRVRVSR